MGSFLSYRALTPVFCLVCQTEMQSLSFVFYHQALQVDLRIMSAQILFFEYYCHFDCVVESFVIRFA